MDDLVLETDTLRRLAGNPIIASEFPFLAAAARAAAAAASSARPRRCSRCNKKAAGVDWNAVKAALDGMPDQAKLRFKTLAGARTVTFHLKVGAEVFRRTF